MSVVAKLDNSLNLTGFIEQTFSAHGLLPIAEKAARGELFSREEAEILKDLRLPLLGKLVELQSTSLRNHNSQELHPVFLFPLATLLEERGEEHAIIAAKAALEKLSLHISSRKKIYFAIDRWIGKFELPQLLNTFSAMFENNSINFQVIPLGPSTRELLEMLHLTEANSIEEFFSGEFFAAFRKAGIDSIQGGGDIEVLECAIKNEFSVALGQMCVEKISINEEEKFQFDSRFLDSIFAIREKLLGNDYFTTWFPWAPVPVGEESNLRVAPLAVDLLRAVALGRLLLPEVRYIRAPLSLFGIRLAHVALSFGANDLGFAAVDASTASGLGIIKLSDACDILNQHVIHEKICSL